MEHFAVAGLSLIDLWAALVPAVAMKSEPLLTAVLIGVGSSMGVLITIAISAKFRTWITGKLGKSGYIGTRVDRFMAKYGTRGLGLLPPNILGPVLTCAGAIALGARPMQLARWGVIGVWLWAAAAYAILALGHGDQLMRAVR